MAEPTTTRDPDSLDDFLETPETVRDQLLQRLEQLEAQLANVRRDNERILEENIDFRHTIANYSSEMAAVRADQQAMLKNTRQTANRMRAMLALMGGDDENEGD